VLRYLAAKGLPRRLACAPALAGLDWPRATLGLHCGAARRDDVLSVTPCLAAVAELGSLVLVSGAESPTTLNFVPEHHLVVVHGAQIVRHFEDAWQLLRARNAGGSGMPRTVNVISGPSRTADVEQTVQLGAHGPRHLHVLLVAAG
jgi:L-lactate utilization protein LutC